MTAFNEKSCKKGVAAMEKDWNSLGIDEPYSAVAVARLFLNNAELSKVRLQIIGNARIENVGKSQSCMVSF